MARIRDVDLDIQIETGSEPNWDVLNAILSFEVHFTSKELELNLLYHLQAALVELDQRRQDELVYRPNGSFIRIDLNRDDFVGFFRSQHFRPDGESVHDFTLRRKLGKRLITSTGSAFEVEPEVAAAASEEFDQALRQEEYKAFVTIRSELAPAETWSNEVQRDLW